MTGGLSSIVGDPSLKGWATFFIYLGAAWLALRNALGSAALAETGGRRIALARSRRRFWQVLAALLVLLGLTRQLDLQTLAADAVRALLRIDDVYGERNGLQVALIVAIGGFGTAGLLIALVTFRKASAPLLVALLAAASLVIFTVIRTISIHDIDRLLAREALPYTQVNNLIELGLLGLIALASLIFARGLKQENESARLRALSIQERRRIMGEKRRAGRS
jgi:hypothetical protein